MVNFLTSIGVSSKPVSAKHLLRIVHSFRADDKHNLSEVSVSFMLHGGATAIVKHVHTQWGERWVAGVFHRAIAGEAHRCQIEPLVVNVGANGGYYGMLAAALGARVTMFDAQPSCWEYIQRAIATSNIEHRRFQIVHGGVSTQPYDVRIDLSAGTDARHPAWQPECDGHFGQRGRSGVITTRHAKTGGFTNAFSFSKFRDGILGETLGSGKSITLVKVDVEGSEIGILNASLLPLLRQRRIRHLVMEATPGFWNSSLGTTHSLSFALDIVYEVALSGYSLETRPILKKCLKNQDRLSCWIWKPSKVRDYVRNMRNAEDLHFERIAPLMPTTSHPSCERHSSEF